MLGDGDDISFPNDLPNKFFRGQPGEVKVAVETSYVVGNTTP
jgi:hypothetical protein